MKINLNNYRKKILCSIAFFSFTLMFFSISYSNSIIEPNTKPAHEIIDRNSGLSNLSVSSMIQDKYGFLWFGTQGGLNRYDGREVKVYRNDPFTDNGLIHNLIQTMYYDEENHEIWLGTYQGISRFSIKTQSFQQYTVEQNDLSNPIVVAIEKDDQGQFWVGTMNGLNKINPITNHLSKYEVPGKTVRDIHIDSAGTIYLGTYNGLCYFDEGDQEVKKVEVELPSPYVMVVNELEKGVLTLGMWGNNSTNGGTAEYNLRSHNVTVRYYPDNRIYTLSKTKDNILWVGSWGGGLFAVKDDKIITLADEIENSEYSTAVIYSLMEDNTGILWIGTNGKGILKLNPRKKDYLLFSNKFNNNRKIKSGKINNIFRDSRHNLWIEIYDQGVSRFDPSTQTMHEYISDEHNNSSIIDNKISDIKETENGDILFSTGKGVCIYNYDSDSFSRLDILSDDIIVYAIKEDKESNLWIGTYNHGTYFYNPKTKILRHYMHSDDSTNKISDNLTYDILIDKKERVWVATNNGLNLYLPEDDKFKTYFKVNNRKSSLGSNVIRALLEDSKGNIWIGSNGGGISKFNEEDETFTTYVEKDGLSSNIVVGLLEDDNGRLWISTLNGLSIFDPESKKFSILTPEDGIGAWEFNAGSFKDQDGTLLFGGAHGVTAIPSDFTSKLAISPKLYISDVRLFEKSIAPNREFFNDDSLIFSPKENFIAFRFTALDYDTPEKIEFSYKLENFNEQWININTRDYISFSHLAPGTYRLLVKATTVKGIESKIEELSFTIKSPWYRTKYAFILYLLLLAILISIIIKLRDWIMLRRKNTELAEVNRKLELKNRELVEVSIVDELTGLYNRRYFNAKIEELLTLSRRSKTPLALLMLDLDKFKPINDTYGHLVGDNFLTDIGLLIKNSLERNTDFGTRFGGDEFAILLYDTDEAGAETVAKKIKNGIARLPIRTEEGLFDSLYTTVSIGLISMTPNNKTTVELIIERADKALYKAKTGGRNKICTDKMCNIK